MGKFYSINPETCSREELLKAIEDCKSTEEYYGSLEQGCKRFINSVYGALACKFYQCSNIDIAESITLQGQDLIKFSVRCFNQLIAKTWKGLDDKHRLIAQDMKKKYPDFDVDKFLKLCKEPVEFGETNQVYGDTDSAYITLNPLITTCGITNEQSTDFILSFNKHLLSPYFEFCFEGYAKHYNCPKNLENFELEKIARSVLMQKKKKYVMDISWKEPDVHIKPLHSLLFKGVEVVKGTSSLFCRTEQRNYVTWLMDCINNDVDINYALVVNKMKEIRTRFDMQTPNEITMTMSISDYDKYIYNDKGASIIYNEGITIPYQAKAAAKYNNLLYTRYSKYRSKYQMIHSGDKIKIYYIKGQPGEAFAFLPNNYPGEFAPDMDMDEQFKRLILDPLNRYNEALGLKPVTNNFTYTNPLW